MKRRCAATVLRHNGSSHGYVPDHKPVTVRRALRSAAEYRRHCFTSSVGHPPLEVIRRRHPAPRFPPRSAYSAAWLRLAEDER
jgi:hypothetical protein